MGQKRFQSYFRLNKILLKLVGLLPYESWPSQVNFAVVCVTTSAILYHLVPALYQVSCHWHEIDQKTRTDVLTMHEENIFTLLKVMCLIPKRKKLSKLVQYCGYLWKSVESDEDFLAMAEFVKVGLYITYGFLCIVSGSALWVFTRPLFDEYLSSHNGTAVAAKKRLPFPTGSDVPQDQTVFYTYYTLQLFSVILEVVCAVSIDTVIVVLSLHATAHMKLVQFWLNDITKCRTTGEERTFASMTSEEGMKILKCIKHHSNVLNYCRKLEDLAHPICLAQTMLSISMIAMAGLSLLTEGSEKFKCGTIFVSVSIQLLIYYWPAQCLSTESVDVSRCAYSIPWTLWSPKDRQLIFIVMIRAQKAVPLTSGKFTVMSLAALSELISKTMSFFTALRRVM